MKKFMALFLCFAMLVTVFASCGDNTAQTSSDVTSTQSVADTSVEATSSEEVSSEDVSSEALQITNTEVDLSVPILERDLATEKRVKILPLGDSFTAIAPSAYRFYLYEMLYKNGNFFEYVGSLTTVDTRLSAYYERHQGTGGHTSVQGLATYNEKILGKVKYDIMILFYGINDVGQGATLDEFKQNYTNLLNTAFTDNPDAIVYCVGTPKPEPAGVIEQVAGEFKSKGFDITYINMFQREDVTFEEYEDYIIYTVEKRHLNDSGNRKFASVVFDTIKDKVTELNQQKVDAHKVPQAVTKVTLNKNKLDLSIGENFDMLYTIEPITADTQSVTWYTSDPNVVTINEYGTIEATGAGTAEVTAVSLDGKAYNVCNVTVKDEEFKIPAAGETPVLEEKFLDANYWEDGSYVYITEPKAYNVSFSWSDTDVSLTTKESYDLGSDFTMSFNYITNANQDNTDDKLFAGVYVGDYKLCIGNCASQVVLYYKGNEVGRYKGRTHVFSYDVYTLSVVDGVAYVARNNEILFEAQTSTASTFGKITIDWKHRSSVGVVDNLMIYTK